MLFEEPAPTRLCKRCGKIIGDKDIEKNYEPILAVENKRGVQKCMYWCNCGNRFTVIYNRGYKQWLKIAIKKILGLV